MPTSEKQTAANRANSQHSTGPRTEDGKARVAGNRRTHSLAGRHIILPTESSSDYEDLLAELVEVHRPKSTFEDILVHQMAEAHWKLRRIGRYEAELLAKFPNPFLDDEAARKLAPLTRYEASARRAFRQAFEDLRRHRADNQAAHARSRRALSGALDATIAVQTQFLPNPPTANHLQQAAHPPQERPAPGASPSPDAAEVAHLMP